MFGEKQYGATGVINKIVDRFGVGQMSIDCTAYLLDLIVKSQTVSPAFTAYAAMIHVWGDLEAALNAGANFTFTRETAGQAYPHELTVIEGGKTG